MIAWLSAFLFTVAFELPIFAWGLHRAFPNGWAQVAIAFGASLITHPVLWFATSSSGELDARLLGAEVLVAVVEALYLYSLWAWRGAGKANLPRCLLLAVLANAFSFGLGLLLFGG